MSRLITIAPVLVSDCAREIKSAGASIWLLQKTVAGFLLRCEIGHRHFRIVLPPLTEIPTEVPPEKVPTHVVVSIGGLRIWLQSFLDFLNTKKG